MSYIASELRRLRRENVRLNRKLALMEMGGKVVDRDEKTKMVRLEIGEDPETGAKIKGPWVRVASALGAGGTKAFRLPDLGEDMTMRSASGVLGADTVAHFGAHNEDENKYPENQAGDELVIERGDARISLSGKGIALTKGDETVKLAGDGLTVSKGGQGFKIDGEALAMLGVLKAKGGSRPAVFKGSKDARGVENVEGNDQLLV